MRRKDEDAASEFLADATDYERTLLGLILGEAIMGEIRHTPDRAETWNEWRNVLAEEFGEAVEAIGAHRASKMHGTQGKDHVKRELLQLAGACLSLHAWIDGEQLAPEAHRVDDEGGAADA